MTNTKQNSSHCPICLGNQGVENEHTLLLQQDLVHRTELISVWINSFWIEGNEGHVIIVPNEHFENLYTLPIHIGAAIFEASKQAALALKAAYNCDGITLRQNNEPAGDQHAMHYHLHVFPRYEGDAFNLNGLKVKQVVSIADRTVKVKKLQPYFNSD
ncbi:MAG: HIT family protein [Microgenomates group bacterium]